jgi:Domain of unknown function (DUF397)
VPEHPHDLTRAQWRKASASQTEGQCVEVAALPCGVAIRDSKNPGGPVLAIGRRAWREFLAALKTDRL